MQKNLQHKESKSLRWYTTVSRREFSRFNSAAYVLINSDTLPFDKENYEKKKKKKGKIVFE